MLLAPNPARPILAHRAADGVRLLLLFLAEASPADADGGEGEQGLSAEAPLRLLAAPAGGLIAGYGGAMHNRFGLNVIIY